MRVLIIAFALVLAGCGGSRATSAPNEPTTPTTPPPSASIPEVTEPPPATPEPDIPGKAAPGEVVFGTGFDEEAFAVTGETARFKATYPQIAYVAALTESVGATELRITITRRTGGSAEVTVLNEVVDVANPDFDSFGNALDLASILDNEPGRYVMRFVLGGSVVAEGEFELVG